MKKRILSALLALCMVFALGTVGAMADTQPGAETQPSTTKTIYVNEGGVENGATPDTEKPTFKYLRGAINYANPGDTIIIECDLKATNTNVGNNSGVYEINKDLTIKGTSKSITITADGNKNTNSTHIFNVTGGATVTIQDLTIKGGWAVSDNNSASVRHAIQAYGSGTTVNISNVDVSGFRGYGLLVNNGGTATASDFTVSSCGWGGVNVDGKESSATFTMSSGNLKGNGGSNKASVVIESKEGSKTSTTLNGGEYDRVYTHDKDSSNPADGDDEITITGGTYSAVEIYQTGSDKVSITDATVETVMNKNDKADFSVSNTTITTVKGSDGNPVDNLDNLSGTNISFTNVTVKGEDSEESTTLNNVVATIGDVQYRDLQTAINAAGDSDRINLVKDVELTTSLNIPDYTYIIGNGNQIKIDLSETSSVGVVTETGSELILDNVNLTINGQRERQIDGIRMNGDVELTGNSTVNINNLRTGILSTNTKSELTVQKGSSLKVYNVTGNGTQSINWKVSGTVEFEQCGSYGMSVESLTTDGGSISVKNVKYGAIYAVNSINIGNGTTVTIDTCGNNLPKETAEGQQNFGDCYAPIQIKVTDTGVANKASITIDEGATVSIQNCKDLYQKDINNIYVPENVEYTNNGTLNGNVVLPDNPDKVIVSYVDNGKVIFVESVDKADYTIKDKCGPNATWKIEGTGTVYGNGAQLDLTNATKITLIAVYTRPNYTISAPTTVSVVSGANEGDNVTFEVMPASGNSVDSVTVKSGDTTIQTTVLGNNRYSFNMPAGDVTITVTFKQDTITPPTPGGDDDDKPQTPTTYNVIAVDNTYGTVRVNGYRTDTAEARELITVTVSPNTGYRVESVTYRYNNTNYSAIKSSDNIYYFTMPAGDVTVTANIVPSNAYPLNISSVSHGSIKLYDEDDDRIYDEDLVPYGETVTIEVTPAEGYILKSITVEDSDRDDIEVEKVRENVYRFDMPRDEVTLYTEFTPGYEITIDDDIRYGEITTDPEDYAAEDDTVEVYFKPSNGYKLKTIEVFTGKDFDDEVTVRLHSSGDYYRFTMPDGDVYITAEFERTTMPFTDVRTTDWYYDEVLYVYNNGLMEGVSSYSFNPSGTMTREMFWAVLGRIDGQSITGTNWASQARSWAMNEGVSDGTNPTSLITREEMVTMLWRYAGSRAASGGLSRFNDASTISSWASTAMSWAVNNGIIDGVTSNTIQPRGTADRAQCAAIFMRYDQM